MTIAGIVVGLAWTVACFLEAAAQVHARRIVPSVRRFLVGAGFAVALLFVTAQPFSPRGGSDSRFHTQRSDPRVPPCDHCSPLPSVHGWCRAARYGGLAASSWSPLLWSRGLLSPVLCAERAAESTTSRATSVRSLFPDFGDFRSLFL